MFLRKTNRRISDETLFRRYCSGFNVSWRECGPEIKGFYEAYRDAGCDFRNGNRERFFADFAGHSSRLCSYDNRKTILCRDIVKANGFIHLEDYHHG